jgi:hypothetical protein
VPQHITQREIIAKYGFANEQDPASYVSCLKEYSIKYLLDIYV